MNHSMMRRKSYSDVKIGYRCHGQEEFGGISDFCPSGIRRRGGVNFTQAFMWNAGTCHSNAKGEIQVGDPCKNESTNVEYRGGTVRSSDEASVMEVEQRDSVVQYQLKDQPFLMGGIF